MSSARCLNWSRPPPGRHPALRKQVSCIEPAYQPSVPASPVPAQSRVPDAPVNSVHGARRRASLPIAAAAAVGSGDFCQFLVTSAIIHTDRFQNYHTYNQARRGGSASLVRVAPRPVDASGDGPVRQRPASASGVGQRTSAAGGSPLSDAPGAREHVRPVVGKRDILCKQLSLDQSILVRSSFASGMATTVASAGGAVPGALVTTLIGGEPGGAAAGSSDGAALERSSWAGFNRKQQRVGVGMKNDSDPVGKKALKAGKDARINIKIFLGQTVQQDSSDTGVSDTEGATPTGALPAGCNGNGSSALQKSDPSATNESTETPSSAASPGLGAAKPKPTNGNNGSSCTSGASNGAGATVSNANCGAPTSGPTTSAGNGNTGATGGGRNSSLAQRRAQFQANRQTSESHDRRHPPLVRALSAPIRPADPDTSKFLQGKKKPRRRKLLREKDEYNICEEDEFSDDGDSRMVAGNAGVPSFGAAAMGGKQMPTGLPMRSRSVLGGACDIETLVSLLSSGGSDSEKEQDSTQASASGTAGGLSPTAGGGLGGIPASAAFKQQFSSAHHSKGRAPMLKKAGKSVSFQETDLKPAVPTAGLNRDYRKPSFQPLVANRIRRTQQLVSTLNAFQLKDKDKGESSEEKQDRSLNVTIKDASSAGEGHAPSISGTHASKSESHKSTAGANGGGAGATGNADLQTPKEQECYRLFLKMSKKGLAVSYDTILRGMLTPTELRVLQKKKSRQRISNGGSAENGGPEEFSPENGFFEGGAMAFEELHLRELNFNSKSEANNDEGQKQLPVQSEPAPAQYDEKDSETEEESTS